MISTKILVVLALLTPLLVGCISITEPVSMGKDTYMAFCWCSSAAEIADPVPFARNQPARELQSVRIAVEL